MSYDVVITGSTLDYDGWEEAAAAAYNEIDLDYFAEPEFDEDADEDLLFLHVVGGIRGVLADIVEDASCAEIRMNTLCNKIDFRLMALFVRHAVKTGGGTIEASGESIDVSAMDDTWIDREAASWMKTSVDAIRQILSQEEYEEVALPVSGYSLDISEEDLPAGEHEYAQFEERMAALVEKYSSAFRASLIQAQNDDVELIISNLGPVPTIVSNEAEYAMFGGQTPPIVAWISMEAVKEILADHIEEMSSGFYFDGIQLNDHPDLHRQICERMAEELGVTPEDVIGKEEDFPDDDEE